MHLLHLEDSASDAELIGRLIQREWPECRIRNVSSAADYRAALHNADFDLILSDYTMPGFNGLAALVEAQEKCPRTPFVFLSGTIGEERAVEALKRGATDYVLKDRPTRLVPAIRQALASLEKARRTERIEEKVREQASLLDKARDAIVVTDLERRITYWNASAERLYGWSAVEVVGRPLCEIGLGFDLSRFAAARAGVLGSGEWRGDFRLRNKAGVTILVESTWSLVADADGRPRSILAIDTDVTERKRLETQLHRAQRMESIGTLAGGVAHDLNNVLTPILLAFDLLSAKAAFEEDRKLIEKTRACASHGAALVQQLLAFARGAEAKRTKIDPAAALADLRGLVRQSLPPSIFFAVSGEPQPWSIEADATQFKQVIINLCLNARDAMPLGGRLEIVAKNMEIGPAALAALPNLKAGPHLRLSVVDSGTGIPAAIVDKIFDPFFTTKSAGKGTGLGLSMVAGIMKSHGGLVQVESEEGRGTTMHLYFPAVRAAAPAGTRDTATAFSGGQGETILLIDDEPSVREALQMVLQRAGYRVRAAGDGGEGIAKFERYRSEIALAISDMMLPDRSGVSVIRELRRRDPALPVIAISGMMGSGAFDELLHLQPRIPCLAKPLVPADFLGAVRRALPVPVRV